MSESKLITVDHTVYSSEYSIRKYLPELLKRCPILAFDVECRSVYNKEERDEAKAYLKGSTPADPYYRQARVVAESSGLSYPTITKTTHFIFAESKEKVYTIICRTAEMEILIWDLVVNYLGIYLVHNALFDLKICYERTGRLPVNYIDTSLMVKTMINHVDIWKAKVGLKELVGEYYPPSWVMHNDYEPEDYKNPAFIKYCGYDGSGTFLLYELIQEELKGEE